MKIVFFGTPEIASGVLEAVLDAGHEVSLVVTRADKPRGRGNKIVFSPVKQLALERGIEVYQPQTLRIPEVWERLKAENADMFLTVAYGRIFPREVLDMPPMGCINIHASLLPYLRGASPINRALMNGDREGGVTVMRMDDGVDTGDMLLVKKTEIPSDMYFDEYYSVITKLGAQAACEYLEMAARGETVRIPQDHALATHADKITKEDEELDLTQPALTVFNRIRGLSPEPCARITLAGKRVKIYKAHPGNGSGAAGTVIAANKNGIEIACGSGSIIITELQPESKGRMTAAAFLAGNKVM